MVENRLAPSGFVVVVIIVGFNGFDKYMHFLQTNILINMQNFVAFWLKNDAGRQNIPENVMQ